MCVCACFSNWFKDYLQHDRSRKDVPNSIVVNDCGTGIISSKWWIHGWDECLPKNSLNGLSNPAAIMLFDATFLDQLSFVPFAFVCPWTKSLLCWCHPAIVLEPCEYVLVMVVLGNARCLVLGVVGGHPIMGLPWPSCLSMFCLPWMTLVSLLFW